MPRLAMLAAMLLLPLAPVSALAAQVDSTPVDRDGTGASKASFESGLAAYLSGEYVKAVDLFRLTAAEGNTPAQYYLGMAYEQGEGVAQDYGAAAKVPAGGGKRQCPGAISAWRAVSYGKGVAQDYERAFMWFDLSSASGRFFGVTRRQLVPRR